MRVHRQPQRSGRSRGFIRARDEQDALRPANGTSFGLVEFGRPARRCEELGVRRFGGDCAIEASPPTIERGVRFATGEAGVTSTTSP